MVASGARLMDRTSDAVQAQLPGSRLVRPVECDQNESPASPYPAFFLQEPALSQTYAPSHVEGDDTMGRANGRADSMNGDF